MEEITDFTARMDQPLALWIAGIIAAVFISLLVFDNLRRRRLRSRMPGRGRDRSSSSRPGFFKRVTSSFRDLREEMHRRESSKSRRHDRRE